MTALNPPARRRPRARMTRQWRSPARRRSARGRALRAAPWGWYATSAFLLIAAVKTWPGPILALLTVTAASIILNAIRPRRLTGLFARIDRINTRRPAHPRNTARPLTLFERMSPTRFEHAIAALAREDQTTVHSADPQGGANDRGADVLVRLHDGRRILIQCKRYTGKNKVNSQDVQKVNGTWRDIHGCDLAVIVTTTGFTRDAIDTNLMLPTPLRLIDGDGLATWADGGPPPWR